jgi:hypothetical protein
LDDVAKDDERKTSGCALSQFDIAARRDEPGAGLSPASWMAATGRAADARGKATA